MGGLLEKATTKSEESSDATFEPNTVEPVNTTPLNASSQSGAGSAPSAVDNAQKIGLAGWIVIIIGAILSLQGGAFGLLVVAGVLVIGIGCIVASEKMKGTSNNVKMMSSVIVAILIASGPYAVLMAVPTNASMAITELSIDETNDELDFRVRGSFDSVDVSITADGVEMWTSSKEKSNEFVSFSVGLGEIFAGNGENYAGSSDVDYVIKAETSNGQTKEIDIPGKFLTREAQNAGMRITALRDSNNADDYLGITMEVLVGLINPSETNENGGGFTAVGLRPMDGDYTIDVTVSGGATWSESTITVDGDLATWTSQTSGTGTGSTAGWFGLTGSSTDSNGVFYLSKDRFYDEGEREVKCYTFQIDIVNDITNTVTHTSTYSWYIDLESGDGSGSNPPGEGIGATC